MHRRPSRTSGLSDVLAVLATTPTRCPQKCPHSLRGIVVGWPRQGAFQR